VKAWTDGNPEYNENASKADQAKGDTTPSYVIWQHGCYEGVDSEKLVSYVLAGSHIQ
jgi:hypothetical protein